jgi:sugar lactone lactonase YvrE
VVKTISGGPINGPWDLTEVSDGMFSTLFVTNVLNGTVASGETPTDGGTVVRIELASLFGRAPIVTSERVIADGFPEQTNEAAFVIGPTGVALSDEGTLYVADTQGNRIAAVPGALSRQTPLGGGGITVATGGYLNSPLGMTLAPNGDILTANGGDGNIVETTPFGAEFQPFDTEAGEGGLFGLAVAPNLRGVYIVNDSNNTLGLIH